jgi:hypothetical protein
MSVRVRKLARELDRTPEDLLQLLREKLALSRYGSPEDLLPDEVAGQLRKLARTTAPRAIGAAPSAGPSAAPRPGAPRAAPASPPPDEDLMAGLVSGVVPTGKRAPAPRAPRPPAAAPPSPPPSPLATLASERQGEVRNALAEERRRLEAVRAEVEEARALLASEREALATARAELEAARARFDDDAMVRDRALAARSLAGLLDERGLKGTDEHGRALAALASGGHLAGLAGQLVPVDVDLVRRTLRERLTLASGPLPESVGPVVWVTPERADLRGGPELDRILTRLSEAWLLDGRRRVLWLGVPSRYHGLLRERVDRRIELNFRPGGERDEAQARDDVGAADLLIAWNVKPTPGARQVWAGARGRVVELDARTLSDVLERLVRSRSVA